MTPVKVRILLSSMFLFTFSLFILVFPLVNFLISFIGGRYLGQSGLKKISLLLLSLTTMCSYVLFYFITKYSMVFYLNFGTWFFSSALIIDWAFLFDTLTVSMLLIVTLVSFLVHLYSFDYMAFDPHFNRFISYLSLFTFFMLILISADNLICLFVGWEGVGICSYLLINFWYTRIQANKSAIKAVLINRLGDCGVLLGIVLLSNTYETLDISLLSILVPLTSNFTIEIFSVAYPLITVVAICFFIGTVGKSAQIGLHTWLPSAMEGPTPVSALIHAATMVTAGIFLIIRLSFLFEFSGILSIILVIGALTSVFAALLGLVQHDLKKIIAYSTCSQLGYMVMACGAANYLGSFFHLINHAFFKALLFLSAGVIIHYFQGEQDLRKMGQAVLMLPFTYSVMLVATFAITGFPFLSGFYSKDNIIENLYISHFYWQNFVFWIASFTAFLTAYYSWRLIYYAFFSSFSGTRLFYQYSNAVEVSFYTFLPLFLLSFGSIFSGYFLSDIFVILNHAVFFDTIFISPLEYTLINAEFLPFLIKLVPSFFSFSGLFLFFFIQSYSINSLVKIKFKYNFIYNFLLQFGFFDLLYNQFAKFFLLKAYTDIFLLIDKGILEKIGPSTFNYYYQKLILNFFFFLKEFSFFYLLVLFYFFSLGFLLV